MAQAASLAEPAYRLSDRIAPEGGKLWRLFDSASSATAPSSRGLDVPSGWTTWVDGSETRQRASGLPAIVQVGSAADDVHWSGLLGSGDSLALPDLGPAPAGGATADLDDPPPPPKPSRSGSSTPMWVAAGTSGAVAAGLFGASAGLRSSFDNDPSKGKYTAVNATFIGSVGMAAVTGGLVTAALVRKR